MDKPNSYSETERKILQAAREVFQRKGLYGARMQEIADAAGINKALLHYYFRNKDKLFDAIFSDVFQNFIPRALSILEGSEAPEVKIRAFAGHYIELLKEHPYLPVFIINEVFQNPERIVRLRDVLRQVSNSSLISQLQQAAAEGRARTVAPEHLIVNLMSLCIFPFLARPIIMTVFGFDDAAFSRFLEERKNVIPEFMIHSIHYEK
jgi:TetR/AcrR family transcriptional regulator